MIAGAVLAATSQDLSELDGHGHSNRESILIHEIVNYVWSKEIQYIDY